MQYMGVFLHESKHASMCVVLCASTAECSNRGACLQQPARLCASTRCLMCMLYLLCCCRWDAVASELICDELGVAYPVVRGIPNLRPADGRIIETGDKEISSNQQAWGNAEASQSPNCPPG